MTLHVLIADDQALIRAGFSAVVASAPDMEVVGQAIDGADAVQQARLLGPDVVLMDIRMPGTDGLSATEQITAAPDLVDVKVLVLTTFETEDHVFAALRAGASGFLGKGVEPLALLDAIRVVAAGDSLLSPAATKSVVTRYLEQATTSTSHGSLPDLSLLTDRETELVTLAAQGMSNDEIAKSLFLSPLTVKTHVNRAMTKIGARDRAQLVVLAYQTGLVRVEK